MQCLCVRLSSVCYASRYCCCLSHTSFYLFFSSCHVMFTVKIEWKRRSATLEYESISQCLNQSLEGPVRSYASALPTYLFYKLIKNWELDTAWMVSKGPALLNAVIVAAPTDWAVWYMSRWIRPSARIQGSSLPWWCLFCSLVSWFNAYALVRTYSNSVETVLLALSLALVSPVRLFLECLRSVFRIWPKHSFS
jgi:hypothetical protein